MGRDIVGNNMVIQWRDMSYILECGVRMSFKGNGYGIHKSVKLETILSTVLVIGGYNIAKLYSNFQIGGIRADVFKYDLRS